MYLISATAVLYIVIAWQSINFYRFFIQISHLPHYMLQNNKKMLSLSVSGLWSASDNYLFNSNIFFERVIQTVLKNSVGKILKIIRIKKNLPGQLCGKFHAKIIISSCAKIKENNMN